MLLLLLLLSSHSLFLLGLEDNQKEPPLGGGLEKAEWGITGGGGGWGARGKEAVFSAREVAGCCRGCVL